MGLHELHNALKTTVSETHLSIMSVNVGDMWLLSLALESNAASYQVSKPRQYHTKQAKLIDKTSKEKQLWSPKVMALIPIPHLSFIVFIGNYGYFEAVCQIHLKKKEKEEAVSS